MSLRPLNRDPKYMSGDYKKMFKIASHDSNKHFAANPYKPGTCECGDQVCFSLTKGALPCKPDKTQMLVWNAAGEVVQVPVHHDVKREHKQKKSQH